MSTNQEQARRETLSLLNRDRQAISAADSSQIATELHAASLERLESAFAQKIIPQDEFRQLSNSLEDAVVERRTRPWKLLNHTQRKNG